MKYFNALVNHLSAGVHILHQTRAYYYVKALRRGLLRTSRLRDIGHTIDRYELQFLVSRYTNMYCSLVSSTDGVSRIGKLRTYYRSFMLLIILLKLRIICAEIAE